MKTDENVVETLGEIEKILRKTKEVLGTLVVNKRKFIENQGDFGKV
jgi:hypothetical protein